jgi:hypothetical protein
LCEGYGKSARANSQFEYGSVLGKLPHKLHYICNRIEVVVPVVVDIGEDFAVLVV